MSIRDIWVIEIEEFEWRKLEKASSSILLCVCVCVKQSHRWFQGKRLREKVGEGGGWTEERDWRIWVKKAWENFFFHLALCVYNCTDDSKEKDRKNWEKKLGKGAVELKKRKGETKIGEGYFHIYPML